MKCLVALVLLGSWSVLPGASGAQSFDVDLWEATQADFYQWQRPCGENATTDGCTFNMPYWESHHALVNPSSPVALSRLIQWPEEPGSVLVTAARFCFDFGRFAARHPTTSPHVIFNASDPSTFNGIFPFEDYETLVTEEKSFGTLASLAVDFTYRNALNLVRTGQATGGCALLSAEYIAALLNRCNRACAPTGFNATMIAAAEMIWSSQCGGTGLASLWLTENPLPGWEVHYQFLKNYNNGFVIFSGDGSCAHIVEPGYCFTGPGVKPDNVTCVEPTPDCDLGFPCIGGCTQSHGYWKTHRISADIQIPKGKAKKSIGWDDICDEAFLNDTKGTSLLTLEFFPFLQTGITWAGMLDTSPHGDACIIAGKQIIAAQLNVNCDGDACIPDGINNALTQAISIMNTYCQPGISLKCGSNSLGLCPKTGQQDERRDLLRQAKFLEDYNMGTHGPGHCDDVVLAAAEAAEEGETPAAETTDTASTTLALVIVLLAILGALCCVSCLGWVMKRGSSRESMRMRR